MMISRKQLRDISEQIGTPDSRRISYLKAQILTSDQHDFNCVTTSLHLLGSPKPENGADRPIAGLWAMDSRLIFLNKNGGHLEIPGVDKIDTEQNGYIVLEPGFISFVVKINGLTIRPEHFVSISSLQEGIVINPFEQLNADELWKQINDLLKKQKILSHLSYRIRSGDGMIRFDEFHQTTLFLNCDKLFCIESFYYSNEGLRLTELDKRNFIGKIKVYERSINILATANPKVCELDKNPE